AFLVMLDPLLLLAAAGRMSKATPVSKKLIIGKQQNSTPPGETRKPLANIDGITEKRWCRTSCESAGSARFGCALRGRGQKNRKARPVAVRLVMALDGDRTP